MKLIQALLLGSGVRLTACSGGYDGPVTENLTKVGQVSTLFYDNFIGGGVSRKTKWVDLFSPRCLQKKLE